MLHTFCCKVAPLHQHGQDKADENQQHESDYDESSPLHVDVEVLERVDRYQYLGLWIMEDGKWDTEFQERMQKVNDVWARSCHFFAATTVPVRARWIVWCAMVRSRLEYGW